MNLDWSQLVTNLRGAGMSARGIARKCGMEPQTISRLQAGVQYDPRWSQGMALLDLHLSLCPDKHKPERLKR
jgi:hypothetical protein